MGARHFLLPNNLNFTMVQSINFREQHLTYEKEKEKKLDLTIGEGKVFEPILFRQSAG